MGTHKFISPALITAPIVLLNDPGDIAFQYELADGSQGIAVALIPEPSTLVLSILGGAAMDCRIGITIGTRNCQT